MLPEHPLECKTLTDKTFWSKFFVPMPIPTAADKLAVGNFIPKAVKNMVRPAKVYWISDRPNFPSTINGPDGYYILKTNHSWRTMKKIKFPIEETERGELEKLANSWLKRKNYNLMGGEWWYATIKPKLFIEEEISDNGERPKEYHFGCVGGRVNGISMTQRDDAGKEKFVTSFKPDFSWDSDREAIGALPNIYNDKPNDAELMARIASTIAKQFEYIRVDFYNPQPKVVILGELTPCPGAGISRIRPNWVDEYRGSMWDFSKNFL